MRIQFLKKCLQECVLPASIPAHDNLYELPFPDQHRRSLQDKIDQQREDLGQLFRDVRSTQRAYKTLIPIHLHDKLDRVAALANERHLAKMEKHLSRKLNRLVRDSLWTTMSLVDSVVNLSKADLNIDQIRVLCLGLKFNQKASHTSMVGALAQIHRDT